MKFTYTARRLHVFVPTARAESKRKKEKKKKNVVNLLEEYVTYSRVRSVKTQLIYCQITSMTTCFDSQSHHQINLEPY